MNREVFNTFTIQLFKRGGMHKRFNFLTYLNVVYYLIILFLLGLLFEEYIKEHLDNLKPLVDYIANIFLLFFFFFTLSRKPRIPLAKPFFLLANMRRKQIYSLVYPIFIDRKILHAYIITIAFFYILEVSDFNFDSSYPMIVSCLILTILSSWTLRLSITLFSFKEIVIAIVFSILVFTSFLSIELDLIFYRLLLLSSQIIFIVSILKKITFEIIEKTFLIERNTKGQVHSLGNAIPLYIKKELRMLFRTKRLKLMFIGVPLYFLATVIILFYSRRKIDEEMFYSIYHKL